MLKSSPRTRSPWSALAVLALSMLVIGLDTMVLTVALPSLSRQLGATTTQLQWTTTAYTLVLGALMIPMGALGDRFGRSRLLAVSLLGFGAASALCAFSSNADMLIVGRALLGVCAAAAMPLSMAVLPGLFPDLQDRQRAMGIWMASSALGLPLGPIVGGLLLQHFWWGSVFLINVPIALVGAVAVWFLIPNSRGVVRDRFDYAGVVLSGVGFGSLVYAFTEAGENGWGSVQFIGWLLASIGLLAAFVWRELTTDSPLVRLELLRRPAFRAGTALASATMLVLSGVTFQYSQEFSAAFGADALGVGLRLLPLVGALIVGTRVGTRVSTILGRRGAAMVFCLLMVAASVTQALAADGGYPAYVAMSVLLGLGLGGVLPLAMSMATTDLDDSDAGSGSALLQSIRQIASAVGVAVLGSVVSAAYLPKVEALAMPDAVRAAARDGVVGGTAAAQHSAPGVVDGIVVAFEHGLAISALVCCAVSVVLVALCWLVPAQSSGEQTEVESGERDEIARPA